MRIVVTHQDTGKKEYFEIKGNRCVVGRGTNADVTIPRPELSRQHFLIEVQSGDVFITDLESKNGVQVNGTLIPPKTRTFYQTFYPLDIGGIISFEIKTESTLVIDDFQVPAESPARIKNNIFAQRGNYPSPLPEGRGKKHTSWLKIVVIALLATAAVYATYEWNINQLEIARTAEAEMTRSSSKGRLPDLRAEELKNLINQNQCKDFDELCRKMGLHADQEALGLFDDKLLVFVNLSSHPGEGTSIYYRQMPELDKATLLLSQFGTHPQLLPLLKSKQPTHLLIIGYQMLDGIVLPKYLLSVDHKKLPELGEEVHNYVYAEAFYGANNKLFEKYLKQFVKVKAI